MFPPQDRLSTGAAGSRSRPAVRAGTGPWGCLAALILVPIAIVTTLVVVLVATVRQFLPGAKKRREAAAAAARARSSGAWTGGGHASASAGERGGSSEREVALCSFVRGMALDESFTREEASQAPVISVDSAGADDYLSDAMARGWIVPAGDALAVTPQGKQAATAYLAARGL